MRIMAIILLLGFAGVATADCIGGIDGHGNFGGAFGGTEGGIGIGGNH